MTYCLGSILASHLPQGFYLDRWRNRWRSQICTEFRSDPWKDNTPSNPDIFHQRPNHLFICLVRTPGGLPKWSRATCSNTTSPRGRWWTSRVWTSHTSPSISTRARPWRPRSVLPCTPGTSASNGRSSDVSVLIPPLPQPGVTFALTLTSVGYLSFPFIKKACIALSKYKEAGRWIWSFSWCMMD